MFGKLKAVDNQSVSSEGFCNLSMCTISCSILIRSEHHLDLTNFHATNTCMPNFFLQHKNTQRRNSLVSNFSNSDFQPVKRDANDSHLKKRILGIALVACVFMKSCGFRLRPSHKRKYTIPASSKAGTFHATHSMKTIASHKKEVFSFT